jgi:hypothetical protein
MKKKHIIRKIVQETINSLFDEERIPNPEAGEYVDKKENFLGSHTYGENIGDLDKMYVAYSYGEQHPLYVWVDKDEFKKLRPYENRNLKEDDDGDKYAHLYNKDEADLDGDGKIIADKEGPWFYNEKPYYVRDKKGKLKPNKWTKKHLSDLKPNEKAQARETRYLQKLISDFKKKYGVGDNSHTDLKPGEK